MFRKLFVTALTFITLLTPATNAFASESTRAAFEAKATSYWAARGYALPELVVGHFFDRYSPRIAMATVDGSGLWLNVPRWRQLSWDQRCQAWIHERGHNAGLDHNAGGIMNPILLPWKVPATCKGFEPNR